MHKYGPVIKMLSLVTQIGITMLTSVFLCMAIGMWIDKHFSTKTDRRDIPRSCDRDSFVRSVICDFGYDNNQR